MTDQGRRGHTERALDAACLSFPIDEQVKQLKQEQSWQTGDRNAITLVKNSSVRVTLMTLRKGARMPEHHVEGPINVYVIEGSIDFIVGEEHSVLKRNSFLMLEQTIPHTIEALEDSIIHLTIIQPK